ncbi:glucose-1-phosphate cytidylyltransferase [Clostridia bacterium]|nr:glucose-1-phosphate cytidylyltransferase [Clostridia bacterium]
MKVVILAGGYGTRISEESHLRPKPMIEIGEMPILWHIMKYYSCFDMNEFIICCGHKGYMIKEYFADYFLRRSDVTFDFVNGGKMHVHANVSEPWKVTLVDTGADTQTGGRIKRVRSYVGDERFMLTYGDGLSNVNLKELLAVHERGQSVLTLTGIQPGGRFGVLDINERDGSIVGFQEKAKKDGGWINGGFMVAEAALFDYIENDRSVLERKPMERLSAEHKLDVYKHHGFWQCMDTTRDRFALESLWESQEAKWKIWED